MQRSYRSTLAGTVVFVVAMLGITPQMRSGSGEDLLPVVEGVDVTGLLANCRFLLTTAERSKSSPSGAWQEAFKELAAQPARAKDGLKIQKLVDRACLIGVTINAESRVKAARGPAPARLGVDRACLALIKVENDAGVTHRLSVTSSAGWLETSVCGAERNGGRLSGRKLEYLLLRLGAHESGKREATLRFDAGQGTQDLGFRAEVPLLFTIAAKKP